MVVLLLLATYVPADVTANALWNDATGDVAADAGLRDPANRLTLLAGSANDSCRLKRQGQQMSWCRV